MNIYNVLVWVLVGIRFTSAAQVNGAHLEAFLRCLDIVRLDYQYIITDSGELLVQPVDTSLVPEETDDSDMMTCIVLFTRSFSVCIDNGMGVYHADKTPKPLNLAAYNDIYNSDLDVSESLDGLHNQEDALTQQARMLLMALGYTDYEIFNILNPATLRNSADAHHDSRTRTNTTSMTRWRTDIYKQAAQLKSA